MLSHRRLLFRRYGVFRRWYSFGTFSERLTEHFSRRLLHPTDVPAFKSTCRVIDYITRLNHLHIEEALMRDFYLCDPNRAATPTLEQADVAATRFLRITSELLRRSGYHPLSHQEAEFAEEGMRLPVHMQWKLLDDSVMRRVDWSPYIMEQNPNSTVATEYVSITPPPFAPRLLILRRGASKETRKGYFYGDKFDEVSWRILRTIGSTLLQFLRNIVRRHPLTEEPPAAPKYTFTVPGHDSIDMLRRLRINLKDIPLNLSKVIGKIKLQEPTYESVVLIWMKVESPSLAKRMRKQAAKTMLSAWASAVHRVEETARVASTFHYQVQHTLITIADHARHTFEPVWEGSKPQPTTSWEALKLIGQATVASTKHYGSPWAWISSDDAVHIWSHIAQDLAVRDVMQDLNQASRRSHERPASSVPSHLRHPLIELAMDEAKLQTSEAVKKLPDDTKIYLYMREVKKIPLHDLVLTYPESNVAMGWLDKVRLSIISAASFAVLWDVYSSGALFTISTGSVVALSTLVAVALRVAFRYRVAKLYCEHTRAEQLSDKAVSLGKSTIPSIVREAAKVESSHAIMVYGALCSYREGLSKGEGLTRAQLRRHCVHALTTSSNNVMEASSRASTFRLDLGLQCLLRLGLVLPVQNSGNQDLENEEDDKRFYALNPAAASVRLTELWPQLLGSVENKTVNPQ